MIVLPCGEEIVTIH